MTGRKDDAEARLNAALGRWARGPAGDEAARARMVGHAAELARAPVARPAPARPWRRWGLAGVAAAAAGLVALMLPAPVATPEAALAPAGDAEASFALLHTPTFEEELLP